METAEITINVPAHVAKRYAHATPAQRQRAEQMLIASLMTREEVQAEMGEVLDRLSDAAEAEGWTDEMNEALLRGDFNA
ncbi:MAG: hypothetical protein AAF730_04300 [Bacteroidota bacterium]